MRATNTFRNFISRGNAYKNGLYNFCYKLSGSPRLLLEVFTRKDFGRNYFFLSGAVTLAVILAFIPYRTEFAYWMMGYDGEKVIAFKNMQAGVMPNEHLISPFLTWYIFLAAFLFMSVKHHIAKKKAGKLEPDYSQYSYYDGTINEKFYDIQVPFIKTNLRNIECIFEPALFFIAGLVLHIIGQKLGILLIVSSLIYGLGYAAAYHAGDLFIDNEMDKLLIAQDMESLVLKNVEVSQSGIHFRAGLPSSSDSRQKLYDELKKDEDIYIAL